MTKNKKVNIPLILCSIFVAVISCLFCFNLNKPKESVYADSVTNTFTYNSSNVYVPIGRDQAKNSLDYLVLNMSIQGGSTPKITFDCGMFYSWGISDPNPSVMNNYYYVPKLDIYDYRQYKMNDYTLTVNSNNTNNWGYFYFFDGNYGWFYYFTFKVTGIFDGNVNHIRFDSYIDGSSGFNRFTFFCSDNDYLVMNFCTQKFVDTSALLERRDYYLNNPNSFTDSEQYQFGYSAGVDYGYSNGYSTGESVGYADGYNVGQNVGYENGYSAGMEDTNQYTFLNLLSATIDAPLIYFRSLFDFEILGFNLQDFLLGLFTICVVVTIFRMCRK